MGKLGEAGGGAEAGFALWNFFWAVGGARHFL